jgi:hypothetical protein
MSEKIEVTLSIGDRQITLAGPETFVREEVQRLTNMVAKSAQSADADPNKTVAAHLSEREGPAASEREFVAEKRPGGHAETVAVLAYFLSKNGQTEFTPDDIRRAYARAGIRPPKVIAQALRDAKNLNDYLEPGSAKGTFKLSPHGERTVGFDLPRKDRG